MTGFAIHANEPLFTQESVHTVPVRDVTWFKEELVKRGVAGMEIWGKTYESNFSDIPSHLLDAYLMKRPKLLHRTALEEVIAEAT